MSDTVKVAVISGVVSVVVALIPAVVALDSAKGKLETGIENARTVADEAKSIAKSLKPVELCKESVGSTSLTKKYDVSSLKDRLIVLSVSGQGYADKTGVGKRADIRSSIKVNGIKVASDIDSRTGGNIDNDTLATSVSYWFEPSSSANVVELSVSELTGNGRSLKPQLSASCLGIMLPKS